MEEHLHGDEAESEARYGEGISIGGGEESVQVEEGADVAEDQEKDEESGHARRLSAGGQPAKEGGPARFSGLFASDSDSD